MSSIEAKVIQPSDNHEFEAHSNPLTAAIESRISQAGTIPFDEYMKYISYGIQDTQGAFIPGYYSGPHHVIGDRDGELGRDEIDFETPSEVTPVFGYTIAKNIIQLKNSLHGDEKAKPFTIIEMGAGNGTFASDILGSLEKLLFDGEITREEYESLNYRIIEQSPELATRQREKLKKYQDRVQVVNDTAVNPCIPKVSDGVVISVELPDAFPVRLVRQEEGIEELFVGNGGGAFEPIWKPAREETVQLMRELGVSIPQDKIYPFNIDSAIWMAHAADLIEKGYILTVDYGFKPENDREKDVLPMAMYAAKTKGLDQKNPDLLWDKRYLGQFDVTAGVDFQCLSDVGKVSGLKTLGYVNLQGYLWGMGFDLMLKNGIKEGEKIGDRVVRKFRGFDLFDSTTWDVLLQGKNVDSFPNEHCIKYFFNPDEQPPYEPRRIKY